MSFTSKQLSASAPRRTRLVKICESLPEVTVEIAGDQHIAFRIRKRIFAYYLFEHHGDGMIAFTCKSSLSEQRRLVKDDAQSFCAVVPWTEGLDRDSAGPGRGGLGHHRGTCAPRLSGSRSQKAGNSCRVETNSTRSIALEFRAMRFMIQRVTFRAWAW